MRTGIVGFKGRIHYHCAPCIDGFLATQSDVPKGEFFDRVAAYIDREIHRNYRLFPSNLVALDLLEHSDAHAGDYTPEEKGFFLKYIEGQLAKIEMEHPDREFLREQMLTMYANPARNHFAAL